MSEQEAKLLIVTVEFRYCPSTNDPETVNAEIAEIMQGVLRGRIEGPDGIPFAKGSLCRWNLNLKVRQGWGDTGELQCEDGTWVTGPVSHPDDEQWIALEQNEADEEMAICD